MRPRVKIKLSTADKVLEATAWTALALLWAFCFYSYSNSPETVPIHYNSAGEPDGYGDRLMIFMTGGIATALFAVVTFVSRSPHKFNYLTEVTPENAERQYSLAVRLLRWIKLGVVLLFLVIEYLSYRVNMKYAEGLGEWFLPVMVFFVIVPVVVNFSVAKNKKGA